jgi:hypothetical protein
MSLERDLSTNMREENTQEENSMKLLWIIKVLNGEREFSIFVLDCKNFTLK